MKTLIWLAVAVLLPVWKSHADDPTTTTPTPDHSWDFRGCTDGVAVVDDHSTLAALLDGTACSPEGVVFSSPGAFVDLDPWTWGGEASFEVLVQVDSLASAAWRIFEFGAESTGANVFLGGASFGVYRGTVENVASTADLGFWALASSAGFVHVVTTVSLAGQLQLYKNGSLAMETDGNWGQVYELSVPAAGADWDIYSDVPYSVDRCEAITAKSFSRIAYELTLDTRTIWVEFDTITTDACETGIPTDWTFDQTVMGLTVVDSAGILDATDATGYIEFWSHSYSATATSGRPGGSSDLFDFDDTPGQVDKHGSFQVHSLTGTLFAFNGWSSEDPDGVDDPEDLGIGSNLDPDLGLGPDWTEAYNAGDFTIRLLKVYVGSLASPATVARSANWLGRSSAGNFFSGSIAYLRIWHGAALSAVEALRLFELRGSCQPGFYGSGGSCNACGAGTFSAAAGAASCEACGEGHTSPPGATSCEAVSRPPDHAFDFRGCSEDPAVGDGSGSALVATLAGGAACSPSGVLLDGVSAHVDFGTAWTGASALGGSLSLELFLRPGDNGAAAAGSARVLEFSDTAGANAM